MREVGGERERGGQRDRAAHPGPAADHPAAARCRARARWLGAPVERPDRRTVITCIHTSRRDDHRRR